MSAAVREPIDLAQAAGAPVAKVYGEPMLEIPQDLYIPPEALEVFLESFEGPLDLLLYLIRKQNVNVLDIPMVIPYVFFTWQRVFPFAVSASVA